MLTVSNLDGCNLVALPPNIFNGLIELNQLFVNFFGCFMTLHLILLLRPSSPSLLLLLLPPPSLLPSLLLCSQQGT
jgi:hypothetical protein